MRTRPVIKPSSLDAQAPPDVEVIYRLTTIRLGKSPPSVIGDYSSALEAQRASDKLAQPYEFLTWWRKDGHHVHKWPTLMKGKRRTFRVSVPYVAGISDEMIKTMLRQAILHAEEKPDAYTDKSVKVTIDSETNKAQLSETKSE